MENAQRPNWEVIDLYVVLNKDIEYFAINTQHSACIREDIDALLLLLKKSVP